MGIRTRLRPHVLGYFLKAGTDFATKSGVVLKCPPSPKAHAKYEPSIHLRDTNDEKLDRAVISNCGVLMEGFAVVGCRFDDGRVCDACIEQHRLYADQGLGLKRCFAMKV